VSIDDAERDCAEGIKQAMRTLDGLLAEIIEVDLARRAGWRWWRWWKPAGRTLARREVCFSTVRFLGERLHANGVSFLGLLAIAHALSSSSCGPHFGRRMEILNAAWDGIGDWHA
jgi:hypothetical protein